METLKHNMFYRFMRYLTAVILFAFFSAEISLAQNMTDVKLAAEYFGNGEFDKAVGLYEKLHDKDPAEEKFFYNLLKCYNALKEDKKAEKTLQKQIKKYPQLNYYYIDLGAFYKSSGKEKEAKKEFDNALKFMPAIPDRITKTAVVFLGNKELDYALKTYQEGEKFLGTSSYAFEIAELYLQKGEQQKAVDEYLKLLAVNPDAIVTLQTTLTTILDENPESPLNVAFKNSLLKEIQKTNAPVTYSDLLIWFLIQQKSFETAFTQSKAIDKRLKENGERLYNLARICLENEQFDVAEKSYQYVIDKGNISHLYIPSKTELVKTLRTKLSRSYTASSEDIQNLEKLYESTLSDIGQYDEAAPFITDYAQFMAFYAQKPAKAIEVLESLISRPRIEPRERANAKLQLADVLLLEGDMWEPALLYGQVDKEFKNDIPGQEAKFRNARLAYFRGDFEYAQGQMKVLKASTTKLIANDALYLSLLIIDNLGLDSIRAPLEFFSRADLLAYRLQYDQALATLDSAKKEFPEHSIADDVLFKQAEIYLKKGNVALAVSALEEITKKFPQDIFMDDALFKLAELSESVLKDKSNAMKYYEELILNHKASVYAAEARKRFRILRGDKIN